MVNIAKVAVVQLNDQSYGISIQQISSIERMQDITEVPNTPSYFKGIMVLHGDIIPIMDLKERLQLGKTAISESTRILIAYINDVKFGLIVDSATDIINLNAEQITHPSQISERVNSRFISGIARLEQDLLILLDLEAMISLEETDELKQLVLQNN